MAQLKFNITKQGYDVEEVDKYVSLLQQEYHNAVEWGKELEKKSDEPENSKLISDEITALKEENEKLLSDCRLLAGKLRRLTDSTPKNANVSSEAERVLNSAKEIAEATIEKANSDAENIISSAKEKAEEILSYAYSNQRDLINEATEKVISARKELDLIKAEKNDIINETEKIKKTKDDLILRIEKANQILNSEV